GPAGNGHAARIDEAALAHRLDPGHDIACRPAARVVDDGPLVGVAQVVAASVIGLENDVAARGQELRHIGKGLARSHGWPAMDSEDQRVLLRGVEIGWIGEDTVLAKTVGALPVDRFYLAQVIAGDLMIEVG